jgi:hypothetical protein
MDKIDWKNASMNESFIYILKENMELVNWTELSKNENAFDLLNAYPEKINLNTLCLNKNKKIWHQRKKSANRNY